MSYAIRNDRQGWRSVDGPDDVGPDEFFSETPLEILPLPLTFDKALTILNAEYQKDIDIYNKAFATAALADGATEESKKLSIRAQYNARKAQFSTDYAALRTQYGV